MSENKTKIILKIYDNKNEINLLISKKKLEKINYFSNLFSSVEIKNWEILNFHVVNVYNFINIIKKIIYNKNSEKYKYKKLMAKNIFKLNIDKELNIFAKKINSTKILNNIINIIFENNNLNSFSKILLNNIDDINDLDTLYNKNYYNFLFVSFIEKNIINIYDIVYHKLTHQFKLDISNIINDYIIAFRKKKIIIISNNVFYIWNFFDPIFDKKIENNELIKNISISDDENFFLTVDNNNVILWNLNNYEMLNNFIHINNSYSKISNDNNYIFTIFNYKYFYLKKINQTTKIITQIELDGNKVKNEISIKNIYFSKLKKNFFVFYNNMNIHLYIYDENCIINSKHSFKVSDPLQVIELLIYNNEEYIVAGGYNGILMVINIKNILNQNNNIINIDIIHCIDNLIVNNQKKMLLIVNNNHYLTLLKFKDIFNINNKLKKFNYNINDFFTENSYKIKFIINCDIQNKKRKIEQISE